MSDVFVLGSGFSAALSRSMPVVKDLRDPLAQLLASDLAKEADVAHFPATNDVELLLSALANPQPFLRQDENLRNEALFRQISEWLATHIFNCQQNALGSPLPDWVARLVNKWNDDKTSVVTLNYDTLLESTIATVQPGPGPVVPNRLYPAPIAAGGRISTLPLILPPGVHPDSLSLIKLHGSLSWYYSGAPSFYGQSITDIGLHDPWEREKPTTLQDLQYTVRGKVPLVIPPTTTKSSYFENETVQALWQDARSSLEAASYVYVLGYSLPRADLQMRSLLGTTCKAKCVAVVDRNPQAEQHHQEMLPDARVELMRAADDCIPVFARDYTSPSYAPPCSD